MAKKNKKSKNQKPKEPKKRAPIILNALKGAQIHVAYLDLQNVEALLANLAFKKEQLEADHKQKLEVFRKLSSEFQLPLRFNFIRNEDDTYTVAELPPEPPQPQPDSL